MDENISAKSGGIIFHFLITQSVCVLILLFTLFAVKLFFKETFYDVKNWYKENICADTDVDEVLSENNSEREEENEI